MYLRKLFLEGHITFSLEIFPPKPGGDFEPMRAAVREMTALKPDFISVTYGAGGGAIGRTVDIAAYVQSQGVPALAHLTCVSSTREAVGHVLDELSGRGVTNVLALRGDIPDASDFPSPGHYRYASELVSDIRARGGFCVGAACYPEGHVESPDRLHDIEFVKRKVDAGCDFLTTQMFFDNNILYRFLYRLLRHDVRVPVLAGIMPVTNRGQVERIVRLSGTALPPRFLAILDRFGGDKRAMRQAGAAYATEQIIDLIANGVTNIHLYTMNKPDIAAEIMANLSAILSR
ncbi:MAG: methylenetetrahydrofolate reductase [Firmicutes bacterium]|nr:methylenetetrahydrofolate reductase [Bacillota bacterium]